MVNDPTPSALERAPYEDVEPLDLDAMFETLPPDLNFILPGLLPGTVGSLIAAGATGKSWFAVQVAVGVALGRPIAGGAIIPGSPGPVTILAGEDPKEILHHRAYALNQRERVGKVGDKVRVLPLLGRFPVLVDADNRVDPRAFGFIKRQATGRRLMLIDTLRRLHHADENDSGAMSLLVSQLERIAHETRCSIVFLHHVSKGSISSGSGDSQAAGRGSSALVDNIRWSLALQVMTEDEAEKHMAMVGVDDRRRYVRLSAPKANYTAVTEDVWMRRESGGYLRRVEINGASVSHGKGRNGKRGCARP
jgi:RecA-family ATPase